MIHIPELFRPFLRLSTKEDVEHLAKHMRAFDKKEIRLISGLSPLESLERAFLYSSFCFTLVHPVTKALLAMGGIGQPGNVIWLLLHQQAFRSKMVRQKFARYSPNVLQWLLHEHVKGGFMGNVTLPENTVILRWLKWLGAVTDVVEADAPDNLYGRKLVRFMFYAKKGEICVPPSLSA